MHEVIEDDSNRFLQHIIHESFDDLTVRLHLIGESSEPDIVLSCLRLVSQDMGFLHMKKQNKLQHVDWIVSESSFSFPDTRRFLMFKVANRSSNVHTSRSKGVKMSVDSGNLSCFHLG